MTIEQRIKALTGTGSCEIHFNEWSGDYPTLIDGIRYYSKTAWVSPEERTKAILINQVWDIDIRDEEGMPIYRAFASTLEELLDWCEKDSAK